MIMFNHGKYIDVLMTGSEIISDALPLFASSLLLSLLGRLSRP